MTVAGGAIAARPTVGHLVVPYMVDATRSPIDFKVLDQAHVTQCAEKGLCGVCGGRIRTSPIAFLGPGDGRTCFADPWMHPSCADVALEQCPFLTGRRDWREPSPGLLLVPYRPGAMVKVLAHNWRAHRDARAWHFEAVGAIEVVHSTTAQLERSSP